MRHTLERLATSGAPARPILVTGETGTGKRFVARAVHEALRPAGPYVEVPCAATAPEVIEADLSFRPPARRARSAGGGVLERAAGGSLVLHEPAALSPLAQARLLEALKHAGEPDHPDVQVISIQPEPEALWADTLRADLRHRLSAIAFDLPPLRARGDDVLLLARALVERRCAELRVTPARRLSKVACAAIRAYAWPGNMHELTSQIEHALLATEGRDIRPEHFTFIKRASPSEHPVALSEEEEQMLDTLVRRRTGSMSETLHQAVRIGLESLAAGMDPSSTGRLAEGPIRDALRARLTRAVRSGVRLRELAARAGINPSVLSRFRRAGTGVSPTRLGELDKVLTALGK